MVVILIVVFLCSLTAFALSALCGGGAGLMLIPVLGQLLPVSHVPAALSIGTFTSSASRIIVFYRSIRWEIVKWFVPTALPAVWLGAWLLKFVNPIYLELSMGLFLVSNLFALFRKATVKDKVSGRSNFHLAIIGFLAGFLSGLTGAVGLLFNKFYLKYGLSKEEIVATRAANELLLHFVKIVLYSLFGLISFNVLSVGLVVAFAAILSSWSMKWLLPKLSEFVFKKIGYSAMVISGFALLSQSGHGILVENKGNISFLPISEGIETKLQWQRSSFSLEFAYDEGFEIEHVIPFSELNEIEQHFVQSQKGDSDKIIIEVVYGISRNSHEAYYFKNGILIKKVDF